MEGTGRTIMQRKDTVALTGADPRARIGRREAASAGVRTLNPGYFAYVMGTGIMSVGMRNHGLDALSAVLLWLAAGGFVVIIVLTVWRAASYPAELRADFTDPRRGFGFFTTVAGADVLAARARRPPSHGTGPARPGLGRLARSWLRRAVDRGARPRAPPGRRRRRRDLVHLGRRELALLAVFSWSVGVFLYGAAGIFVSARLMLYPLRPVDLNPPYWVAMGATAITVLAGARIVQMADAPVVSATRGLVAGASVVFWSFGSWLIPVLAAAGWWRHVVHRVPLRYDATLWSIVFPLGMYGVAGHYLGNADRLPIVKIIGENETWIALAVWGLVFVAMVVHLARTLVLHPPAPRGDPSDELSVGRFTQVQ